MEAEWHRQTEIRGTDRHAVRDAAVLGQALPRSSAAEHANADEVRCLGCANRREITPMVSGTVT